MKSIVITGVSTGIGYGAAREFVARGYQVFGSVRKSEDAERLRQEFGPSFVPLLFDVTCQDGTQAAAEFVQQALDGSSLTGLINNAGMALSGPLMLQPLEEIREHFEVNVIGLIGVTQAFLPLLRKTGTQPPGRILNLSSVNGRIGAPFLGAYVGTKHAIEGISDTLRRELLADGIDVIVIQPGPVQSEIWNKNATVCERYCESSYASSLHKFWNYALQQADKGWTIEQIGRRLGDICETPRPRTRYALVPGKFFNFTLPRLLPDRAVDRLVANGFGLKATPEPVQP